MRVNGASYREIHEATRLLGSNGSYATFVRNRIYAGTLDYSGQEYHGFVPALVTKEAWEQVQDMRKPRYQHRPNQGSSDNALSGLLYCGLCGHAMKADSVPAQPDDETRQALEHETRRLTADLADVEQVIGRLVDAVQRSGYSSSLAKRLAEREAERSRLRVRLSDI